MMSHPLYFPFQRDIFSDARRQRRNRTLLAVGSALVASAIGAFFFFS
jgi:hypothetical protein